MSIVDEFWLSDPDLIPTRLDALAHSSRFPIRTIRFGNSYRGRDLVALQAGTGPLQVVLVAGLHAAEYSGPYGLLAFAHTLATGLSPEGEDVAEWIEPALLEQTITVVPLLNADGAARMARALPGCWHPNRFGTTDADFQRVVEFVRAPVEHFGLARGKDLFLTEEQIRIWTEEQHGLLGQLWSDQGVDLWEDWVNFRAPETRALRDLLDQIQPSCVLELHAHELPTAMYVPIPAAEGAERRRQVEYGEEMMTALMDAGIPCSRHSVRTYHHPEHLHQFPDVVYERYRCLVLFGEISCGLIFDRGRDRLRLNPLGRRDASATPPTQAEILRGVWLWARTLIEMGGRRSYK
jgi:hypothetical protein